MSEESPQAKRRGRRRLIGVLVVVLAGGAGGFYFLRPAPPLEVETARVVRGEVRELIASAAAGEVKPTRRVTVRSEIAGTVAKVEKPRGARVVDGEVLVVFQADELDARLDQAKANLKTADVARAMARTRRETASRAEERAKKLIAGGAISTAEMDRIGTERQAADQAIEQAEAAHRQAEAAVKLARLAVDRAVVKAPYAGVLQEVFAEVGVQLAPGAPLFDLIDDTDLYVDVPVDEADAARVHLEQTVLLQVDATRNEQLRGKVRFIPPAVGRSSGSSVLDPTAGTVRRDRFVYVEVTPSAREGFRIGASVNAEFLASAREDVLFVPTHAVIGRGVERRVYLVDRGRARLVDFKAGLTSWERTEVLSGLSEGAEIVASLDVKGLADRARIRVRGAREAPPAGGQPAAPAAAQAAEGK
ncbi:MAG: efflux RND transporter periplasmic adaptor subunit [Deltaproteobacteria bacterium]|nr:efflux RND transporter periplasmic adaptor subunit [Deltaproteobacteria bacterium]